eukprot:scaffold51512_cov36-Phaeocystis_antarctica.AAC.1
MPRSRPTCSPFLALSLSLSLSLSLCAAARSHVILPKHIAKNAPKGRLLTETEWRGVGVQQSRGWVPYTTPSTGGYTIS